jgi:glycosyltransferase involved in cell wall biosynthesis
MMWVADALIDYGVETIALFPLDQDKSFEDRLVARSMKFFRVRMPAIRKRIKDNFIFLISFPFVVVNILRIIRSLEIDIVHVNGAANLQSLTAGLLSRKPVIWHFNDLLTPRWLVRILRPLFYSPRLLMAAATPAIVDYYGVQGNDWSILPAPCPPPRNESSGPITRGQLGIPKDATIIGFVGNFSPAKGCFDYLSVMMDLMNSNHGVHAVMVGGDILSQRDYAIRLRKKVNGSPYANRFHLVGFQENIHDWLEFFDFFVFPSHSEACPIVLLEAMEVGVPLVATIVGDVPRMLEGINVPLVRPSDSKSLLEAIKLLLEEKKDYHDLIKNQMQNQVKTKYSLAHVTALHFRLYEKAINSRH